MKKPLKKILKITCWTLGGLVALVVLVVATLPLWISPVVCPIVNKVAPTFTKTDFKIEKISVNPYTARLEVGGLLIGNPDGYSDPRAVELKQFVADVELFSLMKKVIHVEEVTIRDCFVSYSIGGTNKVDNIKQILANVTGKPLDADDDQEEAAEAPEKADEPQKVAKDDAAEEPYKVIIDRVTVDGVKVKLQMITLPIPSFTLSDIGKDSGGVTLADALDLVWESILKSASNLGDAAGKAADALNQGAEKAVDAVNKGAEKAADAINKGAEKAADAVKNLLNL